MPGEDRPTATSRPQRTEGEELAHSLRNIAFAIKCGVDLLETCRPDDEAFGDTRTILRDQARALRELLPHAERLLGHRTDYPHSRQGG